MFALELPKGAIRAESVLDFPASASGVAATSATRTPAPTRNSRLLLISPRKISILCKDPNPLFQVWEQL